MLHLTKRLLRHVQHLRAVPAPPVQQVPNSNQQRQYYGPPVCFKCGIQGHIQSQCPQTRVQTTAGVMCANRGSYWDQDGEHAPYDHDFYLRVILADRPVDCLLDTGSEVCLVPDSMIHPSCVKRTGRTLKAANGTPIPITGQVKLRLSIGGCSTCIEALVSPHVIEPMLGIDFLVKNQVVWDFARSTVTINGVTHVLRSRVNKLRWCRRVVLQDDTIVPVRLETVLSDKLHLDVVPDTLIPTRRWLEVDSVTLRWRELHNSQKFVAHLDKLKKYYGDTPSSWLSSDAAK